MAQAVTRDEIKRLFSIFFPTAERRQVAHRGEGGLLVHYTTADVAVQILKERRFRMRNTRGMHDYSEVLHGIEHVTRAMQTSVGVAFKAAMEAFAPGTYDAAMEIFRRRNFACLSSTYITCFSQHLGGEEDKYGRLSMWRAFGAGTPSVAIVLRAPADDAVPENTGLVLSPVEYFSESEFDAALAEVVDNVNREIEFLRQYPQTSIVELVARTFAMAAVSLKHPAFREEREWRAVHMPWMQHVDERFAKREQVTQAGIPQMIYHLNLRDSEKGDIVGYDLALLLDKVIIGPSQFAGTTAEAIRHTLEEMKVKDIGKKIVVSGIPLRM